MSKQKTVVFFGAHPDDETFGIGATLAQYATSGIRVYCVCATRGEAGTIDPKQMIGYASIGDKRWAELRCAADVLGLADVIQLGYRDSGMLGSKDNQHPDSLAMAPIDDVAGRIVKIMRELKPDVVVTLDSGEGYGHPDHLATHNATVKAFYAANDSTQYLQAGPVFQPSKLYYAVDSQWVMKIMVRLMPLLGKDPHRFGRNKDIDLTRIVSVKYPIHAVIRLKKESLKIRDKAATCHVSQGGARPRGALSRIIRIVEELRGPRDYFMREYPPVRDNYRESDLFD